MKKNGLYTKYYEDGSVSHQEWFKDGDLHRDDGPAYIEYYEDGSVYYQGWYKDGKFHRDDGPARIGYYKDGQMKLRKWYKDGKFHREDGPAQIMCREDGSVWNQFWWKDGELLNIIPKDILEAYMKANNLTPAHLFTDPDEMIRNSAEKHLKDVV